MALPEEPLSRNEQYLNRIATGTGGIPGIPLSRIEHYLDVIAENTAGTTADIEALKASVSEILRSMADPYDPAHTYSAGQLVTYDGRLYRALVDITTPEAWTPEHWQAVDLEDEITQLRAVLAQKYSKPTTGIPATDMTTAVQESLGKADDAVQPDEIEDMATKTWVNNTLQDYVKYATISVTCLTQDSVLVTGQTVTIRKGADASGPVYATASYDGQPVSFSVPIGFDYFISVSDTLAGHFNPTKASGIVSSGAINVTLTYSDVASLRTAADIQAALDAGADLTAAVGSQITCAKNNTTLTWDIADYNGTTHEVTLLLHDTLPDTLVFEPAQALAYFPDGLAAGDYKFLHSSKTYYLTLATAIPAGGQLRATTTAFTTYESQDSSATLESGVVSETEISGATSLGATASGTLNHMDRVNYGSNNLKESALQWWLNTDAAASTLVPRTNKFSRAYRYSVAGFLNGLDPAFLACIADTVWKCATNQTYEAPTSMGGTIEKSTPYTITAKFCLASRKEIFGDSDGTPDGSTQFGLFVGSTANDRKKYYNGSVRGWWLRSPFPDYAGRERTVNTDGSVDFYLAYTSNGGVPACKIRKSA